MIIKWVIHSQMSNWTIYLGHLWTNLSAKNILNVLFHSQIKPNFKLVWCWKHPISYRCDVVAKLRIKHTYLQIHTQNITVNLKVWLLSKTFFQTLQIMYSFRYWYRLLDHHKSSFERAQSIISPISENKRNNKKNKTIFFQIDLIDITFLFCAIYALFRFVSI